MKFIINESILWGKNILTPEDNILQVEDPNLIARLKSLGFAYMEEFAEIAEKSSIQVSEELEELTRAEIMEKLDEQNVKYDKRSNKTKLIQALKGSDE